MTTIDKSVTRRSVSDHSRFKRKIVVTLGPGDVIGFRLDRERTTKYLPLESLYDQADVKAAGALADFNTAPCNNPTRHRNV
jgi:hypothetical protein